MVTVPRTRSVTNEHILAATSRVIDREGPVAFTLADVAREAGVSAPLLIQRFDTKRGLLLALAEGAPAQVEATFAKARADHKRPLDAMHGALAALAQPATPRAIANGLAFLQLDVTDPAFRAHALAWFEAFQAGVRGILEDATRHKDLKKVDVPELARAVEVAYNGAILSWAIRQEGSCEAALRRDVDAILAPHRHGR
jgi:AcrR family transcriptional regulator